MPQLSQFGETVASQVFWLLLIFGLIYFLIGRGMVPRIESTVEARDQRIADDLEQARRARAAADGLEEAWRERMEKSKSQAQADLAAAKAQAAREAEARLKAAEALLTEQQQAAENQLAAAHAKALNTLKITAAEAADEIAKRLAGVTVGSAVANAVMVDVVAKEGSRA